VSKKEEASIHGAHRINVESLIVHALVDVASSCIIILTSLFQTFVFQAPWADPASALLIGVLTFRAAAPIFLKTSRILAQAVPTGVSFDSALREITSEQGVLECTSSHFWALAPGRNVGTLVLRIRNDANHEKIVTSAHRILGGVVHNLTVQCERERPAKWLEPVVAPTVSDLPRSDNLIRPDVQLNRALDEKDLAQML